MKLKMPEVLVICASALMCYDHTGVAYTLLSLGILASIFKFAYRIQLETKKSEKQEETVEVVKTSIESFLSGLVSFAATEKNKNGPWN